MPVLFFLVILPAIEIALFIKFGEWMGVFNTLTVLFAAGVGGIFLLRWQGINTLLKVNQRLQEGELPAKEIIGGALLAMGGFLLIIPGFFTDLLALFCLLPPTRFLLVKYILRKGYFMGDAANGSVFQFSMRRPDRQGDIIEGEFSRSDRGKNEPMRLDRD